MSTRCTQCLMPDTYPNITFDEEAAEHRDEEKVDQDPRRGREEHEERPHRGAEAQRIGPEIAAAQDGDERGSDAPGGDRPGLRQAAGGADDLPDGLVRQVAARVDAVEELLAVCKQLDPALG